MDTQELANFLIGKTITGLRINTEGQPDGFDLIFSDGTELEVYTVPKIACVMLSATEARKAREVDIPDWPELR